jgi:hypothetical protein
MNLRILAIKLFFSILRPSVGLRNKEAASWNESIIGMTMALHKLKTNFT